MASSTYTRTDVTGITRRYTRKGTRGRKPAGYSPAFLIRIWEDDERKIKQLEYTLGQYWNRTDFIREAVREKLSNSIYTELVKH